MNARMRGNLFKLFLLIVQIQQVCREYSHRNDGNQPDIHRAENGAFGMLLSAEHVRVKHRVDGSVKQRRKPYAVRFFVEVIGDDAG